MFVLITFPFDVLGRMSNLIFLHTKQGFPYFSPVLTNLISHTLIWPMGGLKSNNNTCWHYIGCIGGHVTLSLPFNMADINVNKCDLFMATPTIKSNAGDQEICKKKNPVVWCVQKNLPLGSLFGITRQSHVMLPCDGKQWLGRIFLSALHSWKILIVLVPGHCLNVIA